MKKSIKIMLTVFGVLALSALSASSAFGVKGEWDFTSEVEDTFLTGEQKTQNIFTVTGGNVKCTTAKFSGTVKGTTAETTPGGKKDWASHTVTVHPVYTGCTAFGQNATVDTTGCNYVLTATSTTTGDVTEIECTAGDSITVKAVTSGCHITVHGQKLTKGDVHFKEENIGTATSDVLLTSTVEGIVYTSTGGICGAAGANGTYTGTATVKGYSDAAHTKQVGIGLAETIN